MSPPPQHPPLARGVSVCLKREAPAGKLVKQSGGNLRAMRQEREREREIMVQVKASICVMSNGSATRGVHYLKEPNISLPVQLVQSQTSFSSYTFINAGYM